MSKGKEVNIFNNGSNIIKQEMICITKFIHVFSLNEIINSVINEMSANSIKILINGSAVNNPVTNKRPNGIRIMDPFKKIKK